MFNVYDNTIKDKDKCPQKFSPKIFFLKIWPLDTYAAGGNIVSLLDSKDFVLIRKLLWHEAQNVYL